MSNLFISCLAEWSSYYTFVNMLSPLFVVINLGVVGFFAFPIVAITLEELLMRSNPYYLVTVQVLCTIGGQGVAAISAQLLSAKFKVKNRENALECQLIICIIYSALVVMHLFTMLASRKENKRGSFIKRKQNKQDAIERKKELKRKTAEIAI